MSQSGQYGHHFGKHRRLLREAQAYAGLLLVDGYSGQEQFLSHCGDGAAFKFGSHKYIGLERMQDYVRYAVQIEPELVGGELVAGHPVGLESVLELGYHLLHASPVTIALGVYEAGALPLEVRHDISDVCPETVDLYFDHNPLLMLPGTGLVHKRMEHAHILTGGLVGGDGRPEPVCRYPFEFHVSGESCDEVDAVLTVCGPVHEVVGAEVGVAPDYYLSVFPLLAEFGYQSFEQSCDVDCLVAPVRSEDGKDEFPTAALEQQQRHIAVFSVIGVEQGKLLCAVCVGIRVIGINDNGIGLRVIRGDEVNRHFLAGDGLKFKQCRKSLVICGR